MDLGEVASACERCGYCPAQEIIDAGFTTDAARMVLRNFLFHGRKHGEEQTHSGSGGDGPAAPRLKEPSSLAMEAYRLRFLRGFKQTDIAGMLSKEHKRKISQGQVSKWVAEVRVYVEAGNVLPDPPKDEAKANLRYADPATLDYQNKPDGKVRARKSRLQYDAGGYE